MYTAAVAGGKKMPAIAAGAFNCKNSPITRLAVLGRGVTLRLDG